jgi:hypothetical protein
MSTDYRIVNKQISVEDLFDGRLEHYGIVEPPETKKIASWDFGGVKDVDYRARGIRWLTDGRNFLAVSGTDEPYFRRYFPNGSPVRILNAIAEAFDAELASEHEAKFWGFDTDEEWNAWLEELNNQARDEFYDEVIKSVNGQPNGIRAGTIGEIKAAIARTLVAQRPELGLPAHKFELMSAIDTIYDRDHVVKIQLDENDLAFAKMLASHETDLPQS